LKLRSVEKVSLSSDDIEDIFEEFRAFAQNVEIDPDGHLVITTKLNDFTIESIFKDVAVGLKHPKLEGIFFLMEK